MHDVYSTMRILSVTNVTVDEWYGYGYLKEIVMRRAYQKLYKFIEGDFPRIHLNNIEDMLLLVTQQAQQPRRQCHCPLGNGFTYDTKGVKVRKGMMQTKTELTLEQTQQGVSVEVMFKKGTIYSLQGYEMGRILILGSFSRDLWKSDESRSTEFNLFFDLEEYSEEEVTERMAETMEQYMSKIRADYGSGIARPKIDDKDSFELKGEFLKELRENIFSGSDHEDANEHIEKVLEIVDLFHIP
ncbi:hypothetical protein Tco_0810651 [Tanacetum coccineum]